MLKHLDSFRKGGGGILQMSMQLATSKILQETSLFKIVADEVAPSPGYRNHSGVRELWERTLLTNPSLPWKQ